MSIIFVKADIAQLQTTHTMKRRRIMQVGKHCSNCDCLQQQHKNEIFILQQEKATLVQKTQEVTARLANKEETLCNSAVDDLLKAFNGAAVKNEEFMASNLVMDQFDSYYTYLLLKYPVLAFFVRILLSLTHLCKAVAKSTSLQWKTWAAFYKCFILEVVLRSKNAEATF